MSEKKLSYLLGLNKTEGDVGVEIEVEGNYVPAIFDEFWKSERDGSLRGNAIEYVLSSPVSLPVASAAINKLKLHLKDTEIEDSGRAGVHVHINCQSMTEKQVYSFITMYLIMEPLLVNWCGKDRVGNLFCLRSNDADALIHALISVKQHPAGIRALKGMRLVENYRYASLNLSALVKYGSLEFRSMRTPTNLDDVITWIDFLNCVKEAALGYRDSRDIVESMSGAGVRRFLAQVFKGAEELLMYPEFEDDMYDAVRRVQYFVYTEAIPNQKEKAQWYDVEVDGQVPPHVVGNELNWEKIINKGLDE